MLTQHNRKTARLSPDYTFKICELGVWSGDETIHSHTPLYHTPVPCPSAHPTQPHTPVPHPCTLPLSTSHTATHPCTTPLYPAPQHIPHSHTPLYHTPVPCPSAHPTQPHPYAPPLARYYPPPPPYTATPFTWQRQDHHNTTQLVSLVCLVVKQHSLLK